MKGTPGLRVVGMWIKQSERVGETLAIRLGLEFAQSDGLDRIVVE